MHIALKNDIFELMKAILTGDIINSREDAASTWLPLLKKTLSQYGTSPKEWEIYRGDSFQLATVPEKGLLAALHIKATLKKTKRQDVRIAIGVGAVSFEGKGIVESNGDAFVRSGNAFEELKKQTLQVNTQIPAFDLPVNIMLELAMLTANTWTQAVAEVILYALEHPKKNQKEMAKNLAKSQSTISEALKRGGYDEIMNVNDFYTRNITAL